MNWQNESTFPDSIFTYMYDLPIMLNQYCIVLLYFSSPFSRSVLTIYINERKISSFLYLVFESPRALNYLITYQSMKDNYIFPTIRIIFFPFH